MSLFRIDNRKLFVWFYVAEIKSTKINLRTKSLCSWAVTYEDFAVCYSSEVADSNMQYC